MIVDDHDVSWSQRRYQNLLDISQEALSIDRPMKMCVGTDWLGSAGPSMHRNLDSEQLALNFWAVTSLI